MKDRAQATLMTWLFSSPWSQTNGWSTKNCDVQGVSRVILLGKAHLVSCCKYLLTTALHLTCALEAAAEHGFLTLWRES